MKKHLKMHEEPEFQCTHCKEYFSTTPNLKRHIETNHKINFPAIGSVITDEKVEATKTIKCPHVISAIKYLGEVVFCQYTAEPTLVRSLSHVISALKHLSKVIIWWYTEGPTLVRNLSIVISALKHLNKIVNWQYTQEPTLVRNISHVIIAVKHLSKVVI